MKRNFIACAVAAALGAAWSAQDARAAGFALQEQGASGLGYSYAGAAAVAEDATTVWWNPAGMSFLPTGKHVALAAAYIQPQTKFTNQGSVAAATQPLGNEGGDAGRSAWLPSVFFAMDFDPKWSFGLGVNTPFGLSTSYDPNWIGRFQAITSEIRTVNINPSVSYKFSDSASVGAGIDYLNGEISVLSATNLGAVVPGLAGQGQLHVYGDGWGFNVGGITKLGEATKLGVHYRSSIKFKTDGSVAFNPAGAPPINNGAVKLDIDTPDSLAFSATHRLNDKLELLVDATRWHWSRIDSLPVIRTDGPTSGSTLETFNFHFRDTWRLSAGAKYQLTGPWMLKAGVAYDQSPVRDAQSRTVTLPDNNRWWLSAGVKWQATKADAVDFGYAFVKIQDANINTDNGNAAANGVVSGTYKAHVNVLAIQYQHTF